MNKEQMQNTDNGTVCVEQRRKVYRTIGAQVCAVAYATCGDEAVQLINEKLLEEGINVPPVQLSQVWAFPFTPADTAAIMWRDEEKRVTVEDIADYMAFRGQKWPNGKAALLFAITEIGEAVDAMMRTSDDEGWTRNNPDKTANIGWELADVYQMISIAAFELTGKTVDQLLREKWASKGYEQ